MISIIIMTGYPKVKLNRVIFRGGYTLPEYGLISAYLSTNVQIMHKNKSYSL